MTMRHSPSSHLVVFSHEESTVQGSAGQPWSVPTPTGDAEGDLQIQNEGC